MRLPMILFAILTPALAVAETFQRPIPQPQTAQAEISYLAAAMLLLAALIAVQRLVNRR
jgi:hypothetical protein